ncbi:MAG: hypothetical protein EU529_00245 [Promethearchaeota archaeon]|nr:MAG: hypothetical protein EU529_00245 [Candidatus Lokiarchaeota archaeon]
MDSENILPEVKRVSKKELEHFKNEGYIVFASHNHTNFSDGDDYRNVIDALVKVGVNLIALTDHNNIRVANHAKSYIQEKYPECGYIISEEVDSQHGDILAYGLQSEIKVKEGEKLPITQINEIIHDQGGVSVIAHPFHPGEGIFRTFGGLKKAQIKNLNFDGIEVFHADLPPFLNNMCSALIKLRPQMFVLGADDAHSVYQIGRYFNLIGPDIDDVHDIDEVLGAMKQKKITILELMGWSARPFHMLPGFFDILFKKGLKRINAFAGIYGLFKGIHFQHESLGWNPKTPYEFKSELQKLIQTMNINTIRLDAMGPKTQSYEFASVAKELGLNVILNPKYVYPEGIDKPKLDHSLTFEEFEDFCLDHSQRAQTADVDIFCIGNELTLELSDDKSGHIERFNQDFFRQFTPSFLEMIPGIGTSRLAKLSKIGKEEHRIKGYLEKLSKKVRDHFSGMVSYASGSWEVRHVPWKHFDVICCNLYFSDLFVEFIQDVPKLILKVLKGSPASRAALPFKQTIQYLKTFKKPVIISELGFQTVSNTIRVGPMPVQYHEDFNSFKYDESAQANGFAEVFKLLKKDIFVNGLIIHEWSDHIEKGFGLVKLDNTQKLSCDTISNFFKTWEI